MEGRHLRLEARSACVFGQLLCVYVSAVSRSGIRTAARPRDRVRCECLVIGRHACESITVCGSHIRRVRAPASTSKPLYCALKVVGGGRTHYISIVCLVAGCHGERWERVAPQPSPRRLRHSGKEIKRALSYHKYTTMVLDRASRN